jgi:hypothetical protein
LFWFSCGTSLRAGDGDTGERKRTSFLVISCWAKGSSALNQCSQQFIVIVYGAEHAGCDGSSVHDIDSAVFTGLALDAVTGIESATIVIVVEEL